MILRFANPILLTLILFIAFLIYWYIKQHKRISGSIRYSNVNLLKRIGISKFQRLRHLPFILRILTIALLVIAFARPQSGSKGREVTTEGIDIILTMDISSSMLAEDFKPNRIEAAKLVATDFIKGRINDRIGLVIFAGQSFTQAPLTLDYGIILKLFKDIEVGIIEDGTAIGMGTATAVNRIKDSNAKSKVIILLTDGRNNRGEIDPITAAQIAKTFGIRIYSIGVGSRGEAPFPVNHPLYGKQYVQQQVDIDEEMLTQIADITDGKYFRATDKEALEKIYEEIGELEKTKIEVKEYTKYEELYKYFLSAGLFLFILEILLANTRFRKIP